MSAVKLCSNGGMYPYYVECPSPYEGPPYYTLPPSNVDDAYPNEEASETGVSLSIGAVAGIVIVICCLFMIIFLFAVRLGAQWAVLRARQHSLRSLLWAPGHLGSNFGAQQAARSAHMGLDHAIIKLLPIYKLQEAHMDARAECAVCLGSLVEEHYIRVLPSCKHTFHLSCIDKWFEGHSNCPLCRVQITLDSTHPHCDDLNLSIENPSTCLGPLIEPVHRHIDTYHSHQQQVVDCLISRLSMFKRSLSTGSLSATERRLHLEQPSPLIFPTKSYSLRVSNSSMMC